MTRIPGRYPTRIPHTKHEMLRLLMLAHTDNRFTSTSRTAQPLYLPHTQALRNLLGLIRSILPILGIMLSLLTRGTTASSAPPRTLIRVSDTRGRVLCSKCHGENDDTFHFCQWCTAPSTYSSKIGDTATMCIDEPAIEQRFAQFTKAVADKPSTRRRDAASLLFERFLQSRVAGGPAHMVTAQPIDVVQFLCWLDPCSDKRRTAVHARDCEAVGSSELSNCSSTEGECTLRYAHDSIRTNYTSKIGMAYERDLGVTHDWNGTLRTGNPVRSDLVAQYMAFIREYQKKAGVEVSQAPVLLQNHLAVITAHMTLRLRCTQDPHERIILARDIAVFTVAFNTTKRGDALSRTLIQRILRLPNECGFLFNFQWGKTMRNGADHLMTVEYNTKCMSTCPIRAVERYIAVGTALGWNMTRGYLFSRISQQSATGAPVRGKSPISAAEMTKALKGYASAAGERAGFTMHSFRSGGALTRAIEGEELSTIMQRAFWKKPSTALRYIRLVEVLVPGSVGCSMVTGVTSEQYNEINEFGLSEQSRHWAAFGNQPMV